MITHSCPKCGIPVNGTVGECYQCYLESAAPEIERGLNAGVAESLMRDDLRYDCPVCAKCGSCLSNDGDCRTCHPHKYSYE